MKILEAIEIARQGRRIGCGDAFQTLRVFHLDPHGVLVDLDGNRANLTAEEMNADTWCEWRISIGTKEESQ